MAFVMERIQHTGGINTNYPETLRNKKDEIFVVGFDDLGGLELVAFLHLGSKQQPQHFMCNRAICEAFKEQPNRCILVLDLVVSRFGAVHLFLDHLTSSRCGGAFGLQYSGIVLESIRQSVSLYASHGFVEKRVSAKNKENVVHMFKACDPVLIRAENILEARRVKLFEDFVKGALEEYRRSSDALLLDVEKLPLKFRDLYFRGCIKINIVRDIDELPDLIIPIVEDKDVFAQEVIGTTRLLMITCVQAYRESDEIVRKEAAERMRIRAEHARVPPNTTFKDAAKMVDALRERLSSRKRAFADI
jgi:hypothetical protein